MPRKGAPAKSSLPFKEINSKLGNEELIKRLKACTIQLVEWDDLDDTTTRSLSELATTLVSPALRLHKSKDVCLFTACCHAQLIRLFHPSPPYSEVELKSVFSLFISQFKGLQNPSGPSFKWHFGLLDLLSGIKAFSLLLHIDAQDLLVDLFKMIFSIINDQQSSHVKLLLLEVLVSIIQEGDAFTHELMDTILRNILEPVKSNNVPLYDFTVQVITKAGSHLEPYIQLFFYNILEDDQTSESELVDSLYDILFELHSIEPDMLLSVLPQLEHKLHVQDMEERLSFTRVLARMFSAKHSKLSIENRHLWNSFLGRFQDASPCVRMECVKYSRYFLVYHPNLVDVTTAKLFDRLKDSDEKVRLEAVKTVCEVASESLATVPVKLVEALQERMRDKKLTVRKQTVMDLARLYRQAMSNEGTAGKHQRSKVVWVPNKLLHCFYQIFPEDRLLVERCLLTCVVPVALPEKEKMEKLLTMYATLDTHASKAFEEILKSRKQIRTNLIGLMEVQCDTDVTGSEKEQLLLKKNMPIARCLPDPLRSQSHIKHFAKMLAEDELRLKLQQCLDVTTSYKEITEAKATVLDKIGPKHFIADTIKAMLDKCCSVIVDRECVSVLVERVSHELCDPSLSQTKEEEKAEFERCKKGIRLLKAISSVEPTLFYHVEVFENLLSVLRHEDCEIVENCLRTLNNVGTIISEQCPQVAGCLKPELMKLAQRGHPRHAKQAIKCINVTFAEPRTMFQRLFTSLVSNLSYSHEHLHTVLVSLAEIARLQPSLFHSDTKKIVKEFVVKNLLNVDRSKQKFSKKQSEWCDDDHVSVETQSKVLGIKLLVKWLLGLKDDQQKSAVPVLRILKSVLENDGDLLAKGCTSAPDRSRMRLAAACGMLKLARHSVYTECITIEQFLQLALVMQDTCEEIRDRFVGKLQKGLRSMEIQLSYLSIFSLAAVEPRKERRVTYREMLIRNIQARRDYYKSHGKAKDKTPSILPEYALSYTVYLLSHHPTFRRIDSEVLDTFRDCLWFFLEPMVYRADNYGFLYRLLETIKQTTDAEDPENSEANKNIYAVCDLAMEVLASRRTNITIGDFPGKVLLPKVLFKNREKGAPVNNTRYLPHNYNVSGTEKPVKTEARPPSTKPTPTKKGSSPKRKRTQDSETSKSDVELSPSPVKRKAGATGKRSSLSHTQRNRGQSATPSKTKKTSSPQKGTKRSPKKYRQVKITQLSSRNAKRKILQEQKQEGDEEMDVEENAEKENSIELEEDRTHTEATNGSSSHATGGRKRTRRAAKTTTRIEEEEQEEVKMFKEDEAENDPKMLSDPLPSPSPEESAPTIQRKVRARRRR